MVPSVQRTFSLMVLIVFAWLMPGCGANNPFRHSVSKA
jgi:hypothetical protein